MVNFHSVADDYLAPMSSFSTRIFAVLLGTAVAVGAMSAVLAQNPPDQKAQDQGQKPQTDKPADAGKDEKKRVDEYAEAARALGHSAAANPECVWMGRRVINLLWRDDLDTAFRHLDLYDRFGCPGNHIQITFRCVVRQGSIDPKLAEKLEDRVAACWNNPSLPPAVSAVPTPSATPGTSNQ